MAKFEQAIDKILQLEGGYVNHPNDPGGETKFGISKRSYPHLDIRNLTREQAIEIYRQDWWHKYGYSRINDQSIATKTFDMAINMGAAQAHKLLQRAANQVYGGNILVDDGIVGPKTLSLVNQLDPIKLLDMVRNVQADYYHNIVKINPKLKPFLNGWLNRARH